MGTVSLNLRRNRAWYPKVPKVDSIRSWASTFFYCSDIAPAGKTVGLPRFLNAVASPCFSWDEKPEKVLPAHLQLIQKQIEYMTTEATPKLTGTDTILCWLKRRVQPLRENKDLLCTYSGNGDDPLRVSKDDLTNDAFLMRFKRLLKERTQFTESFPMYTSINKTPPVSVLFAYVSCICSA